jgi:hypothetical protein
MHTKNIEKGLVLYNEREKEREREREREERERETVKEGGRGWWK